MSQHNKELKKPDIFVKTGLEVAGRFQRRKQFSVFLIFLMLGGVIFYFGQRYLEQKEVASANQDFYEIQQEFDKNKKLTVEEQISQINDFIKKYEGSKATLGAHLLVLEKYLHSEKWQEALAEVQKIQALAPDPLELELKLSQAQILWQMDKAEEAINLIDKMIAIENLTKKPIFGRALFLKGLIFEEQKKYDQAVVVYQQINELQANQDFRLISKKAHDRLVWLQSQHSVTISKKEKTNEQQSEGLKQDQKQE